MLKFNGFLKTSRIELLTLILSRQYFMSMLIKILLLLGWSEALNWLILLKHCFFIPISYSRLKSRGHKYINGCTLLDSLLVLLADIEDDTIRRKLTKIQLNWKLYYFLWRWKRKQFKKLIYLNRRKGNVNSFYMAY